jgi:hypothetical protein
MLIFDHQQTRYPASTSTVPRSGRYFRGILAACGPSWAGLVAGMERRMRSLMSIMSEAVAGILQSRSESQRAVAACYLEH